MQNPTKSFLLIVCVTASVLLAAVVLLSQTVLIRSFERIESDAIRQSTAQVVKAVQADLTPFEFSNRDYAQWDDAYRFMEKGDRSYIDSNYQKETLDNLQVDLVWIVDAKGKDVYSAERRDGETSTTSPAPAGLLDELKRKITPLDHTSALPAVRRLTRLHSGIIAFSAKPILRTDLSGPALGYLVWGRFLRDDEVARFRETSQLAVELIDLENSAHTRQLPHPVRGWLESRAPASTQFSLPRDGKIIEGYALLQDVDGRPLALLGTNMKREVLQLGIRTTRTMMAVVAGLILVFVAIVLFLCARLARSWRLREASERRYRTVVGQIDESIILAEPVTGRIVEANAALLRRLGWEASEVLGRSIDDIFIGMDEQPGLDPTGEIASEPEDDGATHECRMRARNGHTIDVEVTRCELMFDGRPLTCLVARDVSARKRAERQLLENQRKLVQLAHHDALTGLPNRLYLQSRLPRVLAHAMRSDNLLALLYIDIDHFKNINDSRGHGSGDALLRLVAQRLRHTVAQTDMVARMGGDEFIVVVTNLKDRGDIESLAHRIMSSISAPIERDGGTFGVTVSMGISVYPEDSLDFEGLLKHADIALYQAKDRGRNNFQVFAADMNVRLMERVALEQALRRAVGTEQLFLEYQPIVDLPSGTMVGLEALLRWQHPDLGLVPPNRFIPVAEQCGAIIDLGDHVLRQVCRQLGEWIKDGLPLVPVSINISPRQFDRQRLQDTVEAMTREYGVDTALLSFEITEGAVMHDIDQHLGTLHAIRRLGARIVVDDFGTGYSSLSYLKHLPIDALKIDRAFVRDMATDSNDAAIVTAIVSMARSLGLRTVAEGVETADQLDRLTSLGCDAAQGFYLDRPMTARAARSKLEQLGIAKRDDTVRRKALRLVSGSLT
jgi:diguanylate cyclase (GGDEF)-like protein/PAS domain S-box-containing protein